MFCSKCGSEMANASNFCTVCGNKLNNTEINTNKVDGSITFARIKQVYGVLIPIKVYVDGEEVASISAGEEKNVPISIGMHRIAFNLWSGNSQKEIHLTNEHPNIKVNFKLCFGLITSKPTITSVENM